MRQLVNSWVEAQQTGYGKTLGQAIEDLNRECGTKLTYSRLAEWRRGKYTPCPEALSEMLYRTPLPWALMKVGSQAHRRPDGSGARGLALGGGRCKRRRPKHPPSVTRTPCARAVFTLSTCEEGLPWLEPLTPHKQEAFFAVTYIQTGNATEAYRRAYDAKNMASDTVNKRAAELLKHGGIGWGGSPNCKRPPPREPLRPPNALLPRLNWPRARRGKGRPDLGQQAKGPGHAAACGGRI